MPEPCLLPKPLKPLKIFYYSLDGIGHLSASIGFAQALASRGHQIYFLIEEAFAEKLAKYGFHEIFLRKANATVKQSEQELMVERTERLRNSGYLSRESSLEKLRSQYDNPKGSVMMNVYLKAATEYDVQIGDSIKREKPDLIIVDHVLIPVVIQRSGVPWIFQCSLQPLAAIDYDCSLPPFSSGYPAGKDPAFYHEFREQWLLNHLKLFANYQNQLDHSFGYFPVKSVRSAGTFAVNSPYLNFYAYPKELDYPTQFQNDHWARIDAFSREEASSSVFELPGKFKTFDHERKLIYLSLGTIASIEIDLMVKLLSIVAKSKHWFIVSKGIYADQFDLPDNCWGAASLPQPDILPLVDLVITHGGNNTVTEAFSFGKPMIVLPFFADQYDNAQRIHETGYGIRLEPYSLNEREFLDVIEQLLNDQQLKLRLRAASERIQQANSKEKLCVRIEKLVKEMNI